MFIARATKLFQLRRSGTYMPLLRSWRIGETVGGYKHLAPDGALLADTFDVVLRIRLPGVSVCARAGDEFCIFRERLVNQPALFQLVNRIGAGRGAGRSSAPDVVRPLARGQHVHQTRLDESPPAHVLRLLLSPDQLRSASVALEDFAQPLFRERVELLKPDYRHPLVARLPA